MFSLIKPKLRRNPWHFRNFLDFGPTVDCFISLESAKVHWLEQVPIVCRLSRVLKLKNSFSLSFSFQLHLNTIKEGF